MTYNRFAPLRQKTSRKVVSLFLCLIVLGVLLTQTAQARGTCYSGTTYRDAGTDHNYVEFRVNVSAKDWHVEYPVMVYPPPMVVFPIDLWAYPSGGIAKAGIRGTDYNPPYGPSVYKLCTGK